MMHGEMPAVWKRRSAIDCRHYLQCTTATVCWTTTTTEYAGGVVVSCSALGRSDGATYLSHSSRRTTPGHVMLLLAPAEEQRRIE